MMTAAELAATFAQVAVPRLDTIASLPEPWEPAILRHLAAVARLAISVGLNVREWTPFDDLDPEAYARHMVGPPLDAPALGLMGCLRDALAVPLPGPGPARCAWGKAVSLAAADVYALAVMRGATLGPII